jgi:hypothetical protein
MKKSFVLWLITQRRRADPVGDLARAVRSDRWAGRCLSPFALTYETLRKHRDREHLQSRDGRFGEEVWDQAHHEWEAAQ